MKRTYVRNTKDMGRGLFANQDYMAGEVICFCELLVLSEKDTQITEATDLKFYKFRFNATQDCIVLGDGGIFNHADSENVRYEIVQLHDSIRPRHLMKFTAIKPILEDEQLFINYTRDMEVDVSEYKVDMVG